MLASTLPDDSLKANFEQAAEWCATRLRRIQEGDLVLLAAGPLFVCHLVPLQTIDRRHTDTPFSLLSKGITALESVKPGGYHLRPALKKRFARLYCVSEQPDSSHGWYVYAYLTGGSQIELVATASSFINSWQRPFVMRHAEGYEQTLNSEGLRGVRDTLERVGLSGPALLSLSLIRLDGVLVDVSRPGAIKAELAPVPAEIVTENFEVEDFNALSDAMLREAFDQLREKLGLALAEAGTARNMT